MKYDKIYNTIIFLLMVIGHYCCKNATTSQIQKTDKIVFYVFAFHKEKATNWQVRLVQKQIVDGNLKTLPTYDMFNNTMKMECLDQENDIVSTYSLPDPFYKVVESVDSLGRLQTSTLHIDSSEHMIRVPYNPAIESIRFKRNHALDTSIFILKFLDE